MGAHLSKVLIAVGAIILGCAILWVLTVNIPIIGAKLAGSMLVGAGTTGLFSCLFGKPTWGEFLIDMFWGAITTYFSSKSSIVAKFFVNKLNIESNKFGKWFIEAFVNICTAIACSEARNQIEGKEYSHKKTVSTILCNLLAYGIANLFDHFYQKVVLYNEKLAQKTLQLLDKQNFVKFLKNWRDIQLHYYLPVEVAKNYSTAIGADLINKINKKQEIKPNHKNATKVAFVSTLISVARTGMKYFEVHEKDQDLYDLAKQDFEIRNDDDQKSLDLLNDPNKLKQHIAAPIDKIEPGKSKFIDEKTKSSKPGSTNQSQGSSHNKYKTKILESRAWNDGARIYSTKDAIEIFRSQYERYNYANIVHEFDDEVDQTPMNTGSPEYVYARSGSNQPVASSSSHITMTNKSGQSINRKGKSKATNDNSNFHQSNWPSQNNKKFNQPETVNETKTSLPVKLHPIICWNIDEEQYTFSNPNEWPAFPHNAKVIGFIGTKKSGRTTAIHSLLFELGYFLTEEQLAKSLLPIGIMMYVLKKHDLIFLDCCDIADSATAKTGNLHSGYLLEFFTYMASCHLVIHTAIPQKTDSDQPPFSEQLVNYIHAKAKLQLMWSNIIQTYGPSKLTVLVRGSKQQCEALNLDKINLFSPQVNEENPDDEDKIIFTQGFHDSKAFTWQYIPEEMITSADDSFAVSTAILKCIRDETESHRLCINAQANLMGVTNESEANIENLNPFYNGIEANWKHLFTEIMSNSTLSQNVAEVVNYDTIQKADDQTGGLIQEYIDSVNKLVENSATQGSALEIKYKALCEDIKRQIDNENNKPDDEKDPIIGFKINIEIAKCLLECSETETDLRIKNNLISWGLHGLMLIHNRSLQAFEHTWIKLCIKTYNILELLNTPVIYNVHWHCWSFLSFASSCGFKLELIEWQILERALHCLKTSASRPQFHFHVLNCLLNFLETDPNLPIIICPSTGNESNQTSPSLQLNDEQYYKLKQMTYYGMTAYSKKCVREAAEQRKSTNMEKYLEEIKNIASKQIKTLASSSFSAATPSQNEAFSVLVEHQQFAIVSAALARLNTDIALYVSKYIITNNEGINLFSLNSPIEMLQDYHEVIRNYRMLFLQRIASLQDDECTSNLIENTLPWIIDFLKKLPRDDESKRSHPYVVLFVNTLVIAESVMQKRQRGAGQKKSLVTSSSRYPMTINDINKRKDKIEEEDYGKVRMELLSQKCFKPVLQEFLRGIKFNDPKEYLKSDKVRRYAQYINNLLFAPNNSRIQTLSLDQIPIYEQKMLRIMAFQMMDLCIKALWQHHLEKEESDVTNKMLIIYNTRAVLRLLNRIYWMMAKKAKNENIQDSSIIFGPKDSSTSRQNTVHSLPFSNSAHSSETLADEMIQHIGLNNWQNLITLTSVPRILSDHISEIDSDDSLNLREAIFDVRDEALILLWNLAECSGISLGVSKKVMTTNDFRSANVIDGFSDTTSLDENGINRIRFLVNHIIGQTNTTGKAVASEITTQELHNRFRIGKIRAIELKKHAEISENAEKQMEEQKLSPNVQAMKEARLKRFGKK